MNNGELNSSKISELSNELRKRIEEVRAQLNAKVKAQNNSNVTEPISLFSQKNANYGDRKNAQEATSGLLFQPVKIEPTIPKITPSNYSHGLMPRAEFATVKINQRASVHPKEIQKQDIKLDQSLLEFSDPKKNKYFDPSLQSLSSRAPKARAKRTLKFVKKDKFVNEARKIRAKLEIERLKKEIERSVKKTGMNAELELVSDKVIRVEPPPAVEWWDVQFAPSGYLAANEERVSQTTDLITNLLQHPVPAKKPHEQEITPKPILLTKKERKKFRRQRNLERQREKTDKIMLGLLPQEQPKAKIKNMMLIYKNEAVRDPTKVEDMVRAQIAARRQKHRNLVESMKLTPQQKRLKRKRKLEEDAKSNITQVAVFRINDLSSMKLRFKIDKNARQMNLTGVAIIHQGLNVVVVEGGPKSIKFYKKLILRRIDWSNDTGMNNVDDCESQESRSEDPQHVSNKCYLVWEGCVKERSFGVFKLKVIPTEALSKDYFDKMNCIHYWEAARNYTPDVSDVSQNIDANNDDIK